MAKKSNVSNKALYPIKVRLRKTNPNNANMIKIQGIELYTYKDIEIKDVETLMKIQPFQKYLIIKPNEQAKSEIVMEDSNDEISDMIDDK